MIGKLLGSGIDLSRLGSAALVLLLLWQLWDVFGPKSPELPYLRKQVADRTIDKAVNDLPHLESVKTVVVLLFANDQGGYVTSQFHDRIQVSGRYQIMDDTLWQKIQAELGIQGKPVGTLGDALEVGRKTGADVAIFGELRVFEMTENAATIDMLVRMVDLHTEFVLFAQRYQDSMVASPLSIAYVSSRISDSSLPRRVVIGLLFVLLLPWVTFQAMAALLRRQSNNVNAVLLLAYTVIDALGIFVLTGFNVETWLSAAIFLLAVGMSATYNIAVANFAAGLEG